MVVKQTDDAIATKVGRACHRRTPVAVATNQEVLMNQCRVLRNELAHTSRSSRQIASASRTAWTSLVQLEAR